jgi:hypothetical protein
VHASRLKFYADSSLDVTGELLEHVAHNSEGHIVDRILSARYNPSRKQHELEIRWRGLADAEDSWEPASTIYADVQAAVHAFVEANPSDPSVQAMALALGIVQRKHRRTTTSSKQGGSVVPVPLSGTVQSQAAPENRRPALDNDTATLHRPTRARKSPAKRGPRRGQLPLPVEPGTAGANATIDEADDPGAGADAQAPPTTPTPTARMMAAEAAAVEAGAVEAGASTATATAASPRSARRARRAAMRAASEKN